MKSETKKQIVIRDISIVILIILFVLTFFSNTIMHYSLPQVSVTRISSGRLSDATIYSGTLVPQNSMDISVSGTCRVVSLNVYTGQEVQVGDSIGTVVYDEEEQLEQVRSALKEAEYQYEYEVLSRPEYSYGIEEVEIAKAQHALDLANVQLANADQNTRAQAEEDVLNCTYALQSLLYALEKQKKADEKEIGLADLKIQRLKDQVEELNKEIVEIESRIGEKDIRSPISGIISKIYAYADETVQEGQAWVVIYNPNEDYKMCISVPDGQAKKLNEGYEPRIESSGMYNTDIVLEKIVDDEDDKTRKKLWFRVSSEDAFIEAGDTVTVTIETESQMYNGIIPLCALHEDENGYFVYMITTKDSILGSRYYTEKTYISLTYQNDTYAAIAGYLDGYVVSDSSKPITDHMQVRTY